MIALNCESISLSFGTDEVLKEVSFAVQEGEKLGIVGMNGAGKSSLFSIISGKREPSGGAYYIAKNHTVGMLEQNIAYESSKTILEEAYSAFSELI